MKEKYLNRGKLTDDIKSIVDEANTFTKIRFQSEIEPQTALIITDMQNYFFSVDSHAFIPSADAIIENVNRLIQTFKTLILPIILTKHIDKCSQNNQMELWWRNNIKRNSDESNLIKEMTQSDCYILEKSQYDSFWETELDDILKSYNIKNVIIGGVMTHLCVETTLRSSFVKGYSTSLAISATATYNRRFHLNTVINLSHGFAKMFL